MNGQSLPPDTRTYFIVANVLHLPMAQSYYEKGNERKQDLEGRR